MLTVAQVFGVDPGIVDTGCVSMLFDTRDRTLRIEHARVRGDDAEQVEDWMEFVRALPRRWIFIEKYNPRQKLDSDPQMVQAEQNLRRVLADATFLSNTGIRRVITPQLMEVLGTWKWPTVTHHQDLRSAARIALLGMTKEPELNRILSDVVRDHLDGKSWQVAHD
jgi:hypothetical protein